jgi:DNA replication protein DnaC
MDELRRDLGRLKLLAMLAGLDEALEAAQTLQQGYATFLAELVKRQLIAVTDAAAERRRRQAHFPETKTFDSFDWTFQPGLNLQLVKDLQSLDFVRQGRPLLLFGRPGTGKSHLSLAYGHLAVLAGYTVRFFDAAKLLEELYASLADDSTARGIAALARQDLLIIDDLRDLPPKAEYASLLYDLVNARYGKKATIVSSNISVRSWGKALGNPTLTGSLIDRLMDRAHIINIKRGKSYRTHGPEAPPEHEHPSGLAPDVATDE